MDLSLFEIVSLADYGKKLGIYLLIFLALNLVASGIPTQTESVKKYYYSLKALARQEIDGLLETRTQIRQFPVPFLSLSFLKNACTES